MPTLRRYAQLVESLLALGRPLRRFDDAEEKESSLLFRLDVDYSLPWAALTAQINAARGVSATYFVQVSSPLYNPFAPDDHAALTALGALGQRVGLHYDLRDAPVDPQRLHGEFAALTQLHPAATPVVAWHNPTGDLTEANAAAAAAGFVSAYAPPFFGPDRYVSDSNLRRSPDDIVAFLSACRAPTAQVLLHPLNWVSGGETMEDALQVAFTHLTQRVADAFMANAVWRGGAGERILAKLGGPWSGDSPQNPPNAKPT